MNCHGCWQPSRSTVNCSVAVDCRLIGVGICNLCPGVSRSNTWRLILQHFVYLPILAHDHLLLRLQRLKRLNNFRPHTLSDCEASWGVVCRRRQSRRWHSRQLTPHIRQTRGLRRRTKHRWRKPWQHQCLFERTTSYKIGESTFFGRIAHPRMPLFWSLNVLRHTFLVLV